MDILVSVFFNSLSNTAVFALIAFGYSLTFITTETLNFAQGEFVMMGAMIGIVLVTKWQNDGALQSVGRPVLPLWLGYIFAVLIMTGLGVLLERYIMRPFSTGLSIGWIMSTVALSFIIANITETLIGANRMPLSPAVQGEIKIEIDNSTQLIEWQKFVNIALVVVAIILLQLFFSRTMLGKSVRAVAFNPAAASLMGINVNFVKVFTFGLAGGLAAVAGLILAPVAGGMGPTEPAASFAIQAFAVAIIGGLDNLKGIAVAALVYSLIQQLIQNYVSNDLYLAITFVLLIVVLAIKPTGIFGRTLVQKV